MFLPAPPFPCHRDAGETTGCADTHARANDMTAHARPPSVIRSSHSSVLASCADPGVSSVPARSFGLLQLPLDMDPAVLIRQQGARLSNLQRWVCLSMPWLQSPPAAMHVMWTACTHTGSVAVPIPISSVPAAAVAEAAQRRAAMQRSAHVVTLASRQQPAATSQPTVLRAPVTTAEQAPTQYGAAAMDYRSTHDDCGYAAMPNGGGARGATEPAQAPQPHVGFGTAAASGATTFESWLDATLPTNRLDAVTRGPSSHKASVVGASVPPQTNHRWTNAGAADAGCARAAPVKLMAARRSSELHPSQVPHASTLTPNVMPDWFVPTQ